MRLIRNILLLSFTFISFATFAQKNLPTYDAKWLHFGISWGLNYTYFRVEHKTNFLYNDTLFVVESSPKKGINMGIISDFRMGEYFNLRFIPTLSFAQRKVEYTFVNNKFQTKTVESTFAELPLIIKYKSDRYKNIRVYVIGGGKYSIDLASQAKVQIEANDEIKPRLYRANWAYEYGLGFDFYYPIFKFSIEIKKTNGINNVLVPENHIWSSEIDKLLSRVILISMHFE
ncbi:MAG: porin [Bacteroidetes bacterium]|nr:PorT family protein [Bacteroidia bacterium]PCH68084.1 MAG: porin [Bacteroidota bacterium]